MIRCSADPSSDCFGSNGQSPVEVVVLEDDKFHLAELLCLLETRHIPVVHTLLCFLLVHASLLFYIFQFSKILNCYISIILNYVDIWNHHRSRALAR